MKKMWKEYKMLGLTWKQKAIVWYFIVSFCLLASVVDAPIWGIVVLVLNFAIAVRLLNKVPIPSDNDIII